MKNSSERFQLFWKSKFSLNKATVEKVIFDLEKEINDLTTRVLPKATKRQIKKIIKEIEELESRKKYLNKKRDEWTKTYDEERSPRAVREVMQPGVLGTESSETKKEETCSEEKTYGLHTERVELSQVKKRIDTELEHDMDDLWDAGYTEENMIDILVNYGYDISEIKVAIKEKDGKKQKSQVKKADKNKDQVVNEALILLLGAKRSYGVSIARGNAISALRAVDKEGKYEDEWNQMADWIVNEFKNANKSQIHKEMFFDKKQVLKDLYCKVFGNDLGLKIDDLDELELDKAIESLQKIFDKGR